MMLLSDDQLILFEQLVSGKVHSVSYDPKYRTYIVTYKCDGCSEMGEKKVSRELFEDALAGRINLDGLRKD